MAMVSKVEMLGEVERALSEIVTAAEMPKIMSVLSDVLENYTLEKHAVDDDDKDDLLDAYLSAQRVAGLSANTVKRYEYIIRRFMGAVKVTTRRVTVYHLRKYLSDEKMRGISDRTLEGVRQTFSSYFGWLTREGLLSANPTANLGAVKYAKKEKDLYSDADIEKLKFGCKSIRDRAIVCFLKATGCRISEMTQLDRNDVDLINLECKVLGKGNKERFVYLDQVTAMTLVDYLNSRDDDSPALFVGRASERMTPSGVRAMLVKLGKDTNVNHVHPHKFRRTTATNLIKRGLSIQECAAILGHSKLDTTMQYLVLDKTDIKNAYRKYAS